MHFLKQEVIDKAKKIWKENFSDEFGYVSDKLAMLDALSENTYWVAATMFHIILREEFYKLLSPKALEMLKKDLNESR